MILHHPSGTQADGAAELRAAQAAGRHWLYWSVQKPRYVRLFPLFGGGLIALGWLGDGPLPLRVLTSAIGALVLLLVSGGIRTSVTPAGVAVRVGPLGLPILRLRTRDIADVFAYSFSPLAEFGGYGYRIGLGRSAGIRAVNLEGGKGVLLTAVGGRRYLIGTDRPEQMVTAVNVARGAVGP